MSDLFGNHIVGFFHETAQFLSGLGVSDVNDSALTAKLFTTIIF